MSDGVRRFPWHALMRLGLTDLRLPPEAFWRLTLRELALLGGPALRAGPPSRHDLDALMARFPDEAER